MCNNFNNDMISFAILPGGKKKSHIVKFFINIDFTLMTELLKIE